MNERKLFQQVMWIILVTLLLAGCSSTPEPVIEVTFYGDGCTVTGPSELPPGEHTFTFIDKSEWKGELYVVYLDPGKTTQDHLDLQSEPGEWKPKPSWIHYNISVSRESQELDDKKVITETWRLDRVGEHNILCYVESPRYLWIAAPLMIVENISE